MKKYLLIVIICHVLYAQWEADRRLTFNASPALSGNNARCITNDNNYVHIIWQDNRTGNWEIYYKRSSNNGTDWGADSQITNDASSSLTPSVAAINNNIYIAWVDNRVSPQNIFFKSSTDYGSSWSSDAQITNCAYPCSNPSLAVTDSSLHVVFSTSNGLYYCRSSDQGATWTPESCIVSMPSINLTSVFAVDQKIHIVFYRATSNDSIFYLHSLDGGNVWESLFGLDGYYYFGLGSDHVYEPSLTAVDSFVLSVWSTYTYVYSGPQHEYWGLAGKLSTNNGITWSSRFGIPTNSNSRFRKYTPTLASFSSTCDVVFSSSDYDGTQHHIGYNNSSNYGANWSTALYLSPDSTSTKKQPFVARDGFYVHVIWLDNRDGHDEIYYKRKYVGTCDESKSDVSPSGSEWRRLCHPFRNYLRIAGYPDSIFVLYDITGKTIGLYHGARVGENLPSGIYFLRLEASKEPSIKIIKIK